MTRRRRRLGILLLVPAVVGLAAYAWTDRFVPRLIRSVSRLIQGPGIFEVKPYLQLGDAPGLGADGRETLALLWQTSDREASWSVEVKAASEGPWNTEAPATWRRISVGGVPRFRLYRSTLTGLIPGEPFAYRVRQGGNIVFEAGGRGRKPAGKPHRFVVFGDCAAGTSEQSAVAFQAYNAGPDYVVVTGDVVYTRGRVSEYLDTFFPIYNEDKVSPGGGAPLLRSTLFMAAPGNHDLIERNLDAYPDGLAYFYYWAQPLNGPEVASGANGTPILKGSASRQRAYLEAAGRAYPRMANFSFDYGDVHWTILDANTYSDWTDPVFRDWLEADLASAQNAAWRVVAFHQPGFHSSRTHAEDQRMRLLAPVFESGKVAVVFNGHVHNYQRSRPIRFVPNPPPADGGGKAYGPYGQVEGRLSVDTTYDGLAHTEPEGVIYVVTGAGGARLYDTGQNDDPGSWKDYTARFVSNVHSLTVADVTPRALMVRQVSAEGKELDRFVVTRNASPNIP